MRQLHLDLAYGSKHHHSKPSVFFCLRGRINTHSCSVYGELWRHELLGAQNTGGIFSYTWALFKAFTKLLFPVISRGLPYSGTASFTWSGNQLTLVAQAKWLHTWMSNPFWNEYSNRAFTFCTRDEPQHHSPSLVFWQTGCNHYDLNSVTLHTGCVTPTVLKYTQCMAKLTGKIKMCI